VNATNCLCLQTGAVPKWIFGCCACLFFHSAFSQTAVSDSTFYERVLQSAVQQYRDAAGSNLLLYKGAEYTSFYSNTIGTPFFGTDSLQPGTVSYDGIVYPDLPVKYDLVNNDLLLQAPQNLLIKLAPEKVDSFRIGNHVFVRLQKDSSTQNVPVGYHERLYAGSTTAWLRLRKQPVRGFLAEDPEHFAQYDTYYIAQNGRFYALADEKDLLRLFGTQRNAVKKYLRKERLRFKKEPRLTVVRAAAYYDSLKK
jgi:hypothetical protein